MKKWLQRIALGFLGLLIFLFAGGWFLLGSQSGTDFIVSQVKKVLGEQLQVASVQGTLLDRLDIRDVVFDTPVGTGKLGHFVFDWKASDLFRLHLHILEITADDVVFTMLPDETEEEEAASEPFTLPDISLPVKITLEKLALSNSRFISAPDAQPIVLNKASLSMFMSKEGITLKNLTVTMPQGVLQGAGRLTPMGHYPLNLQTDIQLQDEDLPALSLHGKYSGDLQQLLVQIDVEGDINAELDATLRDLLDTLSWQGTITLADLRPSLFSPDVPGVVSGAIETRGDLQQADVTGSLMMRDDKVAEVNWDVQLDLGVDLEDMVFSLKKVSLAHADTDAELEISGTASLDQKLDLLVNWQNLQWPVVGQPEYSSPVGGITLRGMVDDYLLTMNTRLSGTQLPEGMWRLEAAGSSEGADIRQLRGDVLEGSLAVSGSVQWLPQLEWKLACTADGINPEELSVDWPGKFTWLIETEGELPEEGIRAAVKIVNIHGTLRDLPVSGEADVDIGPEQIDIRKLHLASGKAEISGQGKLGENSAITWKLAVPDVADLLPGASGAFSAQGRVEGAVTAPRIVLQAKAASLSVLQADVGGLQLDADLDLSWQHPFVVDLSAHGLQYGGNDLEELKFTASGVRADHSLVLSAVHSLASLQLELQGGYDDELWQGRVNALTINSSDYGTLALEKSTPLTAGLAAATLESMCLRRETASLCLDGSWDKERGEIKGSLDLSDFALSSLSPLFPDALEDIDGVVSLQAVADMGETLMVDAEAEITPGSLTYMTNTESGTTVQHEGGTLNLHVADDAVAADFHFSLDGNVLRGKVALPDILKVDEKGDAGVIGQFSLDAENFQVVKALVPEITDLSASIIGDFTVDGTLKEPGLAGKGKIDIATLRLSVAGVSLDNTVFDLQAADREVSLTGELHSPDGMLTLDGRAVLDAEQNWPVSFALKADNFRLINLPEVHVYLDSDLVFERKADSMRLSGEVGIPKAEVLIRELGPGSESVSPDVVILQEEGEEPKEVTSPMDMDLKVTLGDNVHFVGFGLNAFINGQLSLSAKPEEQMLGSGAIYVKQGTYRAYAQDLDIERGVISFPGGPLTKPGISLRATRTIGDIVVGVNALGPILKPRLTTFSRPPMSESATISYLLTGSAPEGGHGGVKLSVGRQINNKLSVSVGTDVKTGESEFITRYRLNRKIYIQTTTATNSNAVDLFYTLEVGGVDDLVKEIVTKDLKLNVLTGK